MILHYNEDGSIEMILKMGRGIIRRKFSSENEYLEYISFLN